MKIWVYIDNSNLFREVKDSFGNVRIDYKLLKQFIENTCHKLYGSDLVFLHNVYASERKLGDTPQSLFYKKLQYFGYNVKTFELQEHDNVLTEAGIVDIALATDAAIGAARDFYDICLLVAGDGGYAFLGDAIKSNGKIFDVMFPEHSLSDKLRRRAHYYTKIDASVIETLKLQEVTDEISTQNKA